MFNERQQVRMRRALREVTPAMVHELIEIALSDDAKAPLWGPPDDCSAPEFGGPYPCAPSTATYPGRLRDESIETFVGSLPKRAQAELRALMYLGRDTLMTTVSGFEYMCGDLEQAWNAPVHLQSKYGTLATHLSKALRVLGL